jgi:hypothetical protein
VKANRGEGQQEKIKCILAYLAQVVESMPQGRFLCCGSGSGFNWVAGSGSRRAKMTHKNLKSYQIAFSEVLDVL